MIRINLMPRAEARRQAARQRDRQIAALMVGLLVASIVASEILTRREANRAEAESKAHEAELIELNKRHQDAILLERKRTQLRAKLSTIDQLDRQRRGPVHVLDDLSGATPEKLWLTEMRESGGALTLIGKGLDNQTIAQFMRKLSVSQYFENVDLVETKQIEEGQAKLKQFTISAHVNYAGRAPVEPPLTGGADAGPGGADVGPGAAEAPGGSTGTGVVSAPGAPAMAGSAAALPVGGPLGSAVAARNAAVGASEISGARDAAVKRAAPGASRAGTP